MLEELQGFLYGHIEDVIDGLSFIFNFQSLAVVALAAANFAGNVYVRKEMHLDLQDPIAAAGLTASALDVEAETPLFVAARLGIGG